MNISLRSLFLMDQSILLVFPDVIKLARICIKALFVNHTTFPSRYNSRPMVESILSRATPPDVVVDPYVHFAVQRPLSEAYYHQLEESYPADEYIIALDRMCNVRKQNTRYQISASEALGTDCELAQVWREFIDYHTSSEFYREVVSLLGNHIRATHPNLERRLGKSLDACTVGRRFEASVDISLDCQVGINTPVEVSSSVRRVHTDAPVELFAMLLYFRGTDDAVKGGDLEIYRWITGNRRFRGSEVDEQDAEYLRTIDYRPNVLVGFINSDEALHAVSYRPPNPYTRRLVNIIGEVDRSIPEGLFEQPQKPRPPWYRRSIRRLRRSIKKRIASTDQ
ncbi:MAG: hypothetical protein QNI91_08310 [Arenicellales bacterium]|nr:hypothetical protein [Arenicellales bacterium]